MPQRHKVAGIAAALLWAVVSAHSGVAGGPVPISRGEAVNLRRHLAPGKYTIVDFYAPWSPAGVSLSPKIEALARNHAARAVYRRIEIREWDDPVVRQHAVRALPHVLVFGPEGKLLASGLAGFRLAEALLSRREVPPPALASAEEPPRAPALPQG